MIRAVAFVWAWLTGRFRRPSLEAPAVEYDPKRDDLVRHFRRERLAAERATHRIERRMNLIEQEHLPRRKGGA